MRLASTVVKNIMIFSNGVVWGNVSLKANSLDMLRRNGRVPKETKRNSRARNPKHPHKNFLSLSILWPYRSENELAGAFQDVTRLPANIHSVAVSGKFISVTRGISAIPHQNPVLTGSIAASI
jgi:hypothetical protein